MGSEQLSPYWGCPSWSPFLAGQNRDGGLLAGLLVDNDDLIDEEAGQSKHDVSLYQWMGTGIAPVKIRGYLITP